MPKRIKMRKVIFKIAAVVVMSLSLASCSSTQSLQEYYVDNSENPNFLSFDLPASLLNLEEVQLTEKQKEAVSSLKKLNVLAFKKTMDNAVEYKTEDENVKAILKNDKYTQLMKMNLSFAKATVKYLGKEDAIDEVVIYGSNKDKGFAVIRVLGDNINPANLVQLLQAVQKSDYKGEGLGQLTDLFKE